MSTREGLWSARWYPLAASIRPTTKSTFNGGSAANYQFPLISNWDGGSASTGRLRCGSIDGGNA